MAWPMRCSGDASVYFHLPPGTITWAQVDDQLRRKGSSLLNLFVEKGYLLPKPTSLSIQEVLQACQKFHQRTGEWPKITSGDASQDIGFRIFWSSINWALVEGQWGLPGGQTLNQLLHDEGLRYSVRARPPSLTEGDLIKAAKKHHRRTGSWPNQTSGDAFQDIGHRTSWSSIATACRDGKWGLPGGKTLNNLLHETGLKHNRSQPRQVSEAVVVQASQAFYRTYGRWPVAGRDGDASRFLPFRTTWMGINLALRRGSWGLPGGTSLAALLHHQGLKANRLGVMITEDDVVQAAYNCLRRTGSWPTESTGDASEDFGIDGWSTSWLSISRNLRRGNIGLPGGSSIARLLHRRGLKPHPRLKEPFIPALKLGSHKLSVEMGIK